MAKKKPAAWTVAPLEKAMKASSGAAVAIDVSMHLRTLGVPTRMRHDYLTQATINNWAAGRTVPMSDMLPALAAACGCEVVDFFRG